MKHSANSYLFAFSLAFVGCSAPHETVSELSTQRSSDFADNDGDSYSVEDGDCDDSDPRAFPGAAFLESMAHLCMKDSDLDGYGDNHPPRNITAGMDCNDAAASLNYSDMDGDGLSTCAGDLNDFDPEITSGGHVSPLGFSMVLIEAGDFEMGCMEGDDLCNDHEFPVRQVEITRDLVMSATEVTQAQWEAVMGEWEFYHDNCSGCPAENLIWAEAVEFANALSELEGLTPVYRVEPNIGYLFDEAGDGYRLPTESEWEFAARCGAETLFAGSEFSPEVAWSIDNSGISSRSVGQKRPNNCGLYDMSGNVFEWVWDWYEEEAYTFDSNIDPQGPREGDRRVVRGGSWKRTDYASRVTYRTRHDMDHMDRNIGLRVVRAIQRY
jgi:formylglycine-generating enzyme